MKVLAFAGAVAVSMLVAGGVLSLGAVWDLSALSLPIAIGVAVLRYGLFDIDIVISRTLVYVPLIAIIGGVSTALVPFSQRAFEGVTGSDSDAAIVLTALLVAALVTPLRKRLEAAVEGRFRFTPTPRSDARQLLDDPEFVALVHSIAERAARQAVDELVSREGRQAERRDH